MTASYEDLLKSAWEGEVLAHERALGADLERVRAVGAACTEHVTQFLEHIASAAR